MALTDRSTQRALWCDSITQNTTASLHKNEGELIKNEEERDHKKKIQKTGDQTVCEIKYKTKFAPTHRG